MEEKEINQEIEALEQELKGLKDEIKTIDKFIKDKKMDNDSYKDFMLEKKQLEKFVNEVELELALLNQQKDGNGQVDYDKMKELFGAPLSEIYDLTGYENNPNDIIKDIESGKLKPKNNQEPN